MRIKLTQEQAMELITEGGLVYFYNDAESAFDPIETVYDLVMISVAFLPSEYWGEILEK